MPFLLVFVFLVFMLGRVSRLLGTAGGGLLMPFLADTALAPGPLMLLGLGGIGLARGYVVASIAGASSIGPRPPGRGGYGGGSPDPLSARGRRLSAGGGRLLGREAAVLAVAALPGVGDTEVVSRWALSSGAFRQYLSGPAAVATAGEEIAADHADGRPHRDSMRIDKIAQLG